MQRLKHPIRSIREPFGKAGLTVAVLALVLAMVGGAYAAGGLTKPQEKQVTKIAKKYAGKPGANGTNGTNGSNGAPGAKGDKGDTGSAGGAGAPGTSVVSEEFGTVGKEGKCVGTGGSKFTAGATKTFACNGKTGFTKTLPSGETETGSWSVSNLTAEPSVYFVPISFNIPLEAELDESHVHFLAAGATATTECPGSVAQPKAVAGNLCVYEAALPGPFAPFQVGAPENGIRTPSLAEGAGVSGAVLWFGETNTGKFGLGSWAVTAE